MIIKPAIGIATVAVAIVLCFTAVASDSTPTEKVSAVDATQYADFMANETLDMQDLAENAEDQRRLFDRITPPGFSWIQPMLPTVVPFNADNFDDKFLANLLGEDKNSVAVYPLSLSMNPKTRETLIFNADGKLIASVPADKDVPGWPENADPSRVTLRLDLLPSEDVEPYLYTESRVTESSVYKSAKVKGAAMKSLEISEFGIAGVQTMTNGSMRLTVSNGTDVAEVFAYTVLHTSATVVVTWTNEQSNVVTDTNTLWYPVSPPFNGIESAWESQTTNLLLTNGVGMWEDANTASNKRVRFYAVAKRADTDTDGLTDGVEVFLHHSDPLLSDTDEDGIPDGAEIAMELDPLDSSDANSDPDGDQLSNREEFDLGTDINLSNSVVNVYFVNSTNWLTDGRRSSGGAETMFYATWTSLQAKAAATIRYKEGYPEYTSTNLTPSEPPKWYLGEDYFYNGEGESSKTAYNISFHAIHVGNHHCCKEFDPNGWPSSPTNHICTGMLDTSLEQIGECYYDYDTMFYAFTNPSDLVPWTQQLLWNTCDVTTTYEHVDYNASCCRPDAPSPYIISHTYAYISNNWNKWLLNYGMDQYDGYQVVQKTLSHEYTDDTLHFYTEADLVLISSWDVFDWGLRRFRENHRQTPDLESLPTNEYYSCYLMSTNHSSIQMQALHYRWALPTVSGIVYRICWWEKFIPKDPSHPSNVVSKSITLLGTGDIEYSRTLDLPPSAEEGHTHVVPMDEVLKVEFVYQDETPVGDETIVGGIEFTSVMPTIDNTTQDMLLYIRVTPYSQEIMDYFQGLVLEKNGMGVFGIDFPPDSTGLSKPILPITPHYKESLLSGITDFHIVKVSEDDVLAVKPWASVCDDFDQVTMDDTHVPISAKIVKGETSGIGSTRTAADIQGMLSGIDNVNTVWAQFGYQYELLGINQALQVPDSFADSTEWKTIASDHFRESRAPVDLYATPPALIGFAHTFSWGRNPGDANPSVSEVNDPNNNLTVEVYRVDGGSPTLVETYAGTTSAKPGGGVWINCTRSIGTAMDPDYEYVAVFKVEVTSSGVTHESSALSLGANEFASVTRLDRDSTAINAYFFHDLVGAENGGGLATGPSGSTSATPIAYGVDEDLSGYYFMIVNAHEIGHIFDLPDLFNGPYNLLMSGFGDDLDIDTEYDSSLSHAGGYDNN